MPPVSWLKLEHEESLKMFLIFLEQWELCSSSREGKEHPVISRAVLMILWSVFFFAPVQLGNHTQRHTGRSRYGAAVHQLRNVILSENSREIRFLLDFLHQLSRVCTPVWVFRDVGSLWHGTDTHSHSPFGYMVGFPFSWTSQQASWSKLCSGAVCCLCTTTLLAAPHHLCRLIDAVNH